MFFFLYLLYKNHSPIDGSAVRSAFDEFRRKKVRRSGCFAIVKLCISSAEKTLEPFSREHSYTDFDRVKVDHFQSAARSDDQI